MWHILTRLLRADPGAEGEKRSYLLLAVRADRDGKRPRHVRSWLRLKRARPKKRLASARLAPPSLHLAVRARSFVGTIRQPLGRERYPPTCCVRAEIQHLQRARDEPHPERERVAAHGAARWRGPTKRRANPQQARVGLAPPMERRSDA
eukprot:scaffold101032_cov28-Tisochrysis_lutea.AAC.4